MKLEYRCSVKCSPEAAIAYLHDLPQYCANHSLRGVTWQMVDKETFKQIMNMGKLGMSECVYKVALLPDGLFSVIVDGQGPGTMEHISVTSIDGKTTVTWALAPKFDGVIPEAVRKAMKESIILKMVEKSLKLEAQVDIDWLEKHGNHPA